MYSMDILCLANSWKIGGACIAGVRMDNGEWVRPVTDTANGTLPFMQCQLQGGRKVQPLDIITIPVVEPMPKGLLHLRSGWRGMGR